MAYQAAERGTLALDERVEIGSEDRRPGSGILQFHDPGLQPTVRDLITDMIVTSDNMAADLLIAKLGGVAAINRWLNDAGFPKLQLFRTTSEWFRLPLIASDAGADDLSATEVFAISARRIEPSRSRPLVDRVRAASGTEASWSSFARRASVRSPNATRPTSMPAS